MVFSRARWREVIVLRGMTASDFDESDFLVERPCRFGRWQPENQWSLKWQFLFSNHLRISISWRGSYTCAFAGATNCRSKNEIFVQSSVEIGIFHGPHYSFGVRNLAVSTQLPTLAAPHTAREAAMMR